MERVKFPEVNITREAYSKSTIDFVLRKLEKVKHGEELLLNFYRSAVKGESLQTV